MDLSVRYLALDLANPLVASAGPLTADPDQLRRLEDAGIAAAVLPSLFEEQIEHLELEFHRLLEYQTESFAESLTHFPACDAPTSLPEDYLRKVEAARQAVDIPLVASLNGHSSGGWTRYAKFLESAGADALELNIYFVPTDPAMDAAAVESRYEALVATVAQAVDIPVAVKIGAQFSALPNFCQRLWHAGAAGLVLFNRYLEPDIDLASLEYRPDLVLSRRHELRTVLRWIAILRDQVDCSLAATSGIQRAEDMVRALLAGADVAMVTTAFLRHGPAYAARLLEELRTWLAEGDYESVAQMRGSMSRANCRDPSALERANYMQALARYTAQFGR
jgi:dihydroorotate dehydrogenase (fumarate)